MQVSVRKDERHLHMHLVFADLVSVDDDLLVLYPCTFDIFQGFDGSLDAGPDCVIETVRRYSCNFRNSRN